LVQQKSVLFGNHMVSLPWFDAAGVLTNSPAARDALIQAACEHARRCGAKQLHLRQLEPLDDSYPARTDKVLMRLALPADPETLWKSFSPKVRNQVRKAEKSGLTVQSGGAEMLGDFFEIYSVNMRDLGSPSHSRSFLEAVAETFPQQVRISVVRLEGQPIGVGLTLAGGEVTEIPWASSLRQHNALCVNHQLYWSILRQACEDGYRWFHFGRSSVDSGTYRFKRQWGAEPHTLHWYNIDPRSGEFLAAERSEESFGMAQRLWTRLPVCVSRLLGPRIIRHVA
jgi:serine/alanine adding enzyme